MFRLKFGGNSIVVKDPTFLLEHLDANNLPRGVLDDVNFFTNAALPELPFGRFLVSAKEWEDAGFPDISSTTAELTVEIIGQQRTVTFEDLPVLYIGYVMGGITLSPVNTPTLGRLLLVEVGGLPANYTAIPSPIISLFDNNANDINFNNFVLNSAILPSVPNFNSYRSNSPLFAATGAVHYKDWAYFIANSHFAVAYCDYTNNAGQFRVTNTFSTRTDSGCRLIYSQALANQNPGYLGGVAFQTFVPNRVYTKVYSDPGSQDVNYTESQLYFKTEWGTARGGYFMFYPFMKVNPNFDISVNTTAADIFNALKTNLAKRVVRSIDLVYTDVVDCSIGMDIQRITYRIDNNALTTRLQSVPWCNYNPFNLPVPVPCTQQVEVFRLLSPWYAGVALAEFTRFGTVDYWSNEKQGVIEDPKQIYREMLIGTSGYSIRTCEDRHIAIAAGCDTKAVAVPPINPTGKCCYQSGSGFACFEGTEASCNSWGGTYGGDGTRCSEGCTSGELPPNDNSQGYNGDLEDLWDLINHIA